MTAVSRVGCRVPLGEVSGMDETITLLLEQGEDWLQFAVRHRLLRDDGPALTDARNRALRDPKIAGLLRDVADFHGTLVTSHKNAGLPLHKLTFLLDLGFGREVPQIASAVAAILTHRDTRGVYQSVSRIPVRYGGTDQEVFGWALCDAPVLLTALAMAGVDFEEHVRQGFDSLTALFRDGKFHCGVSQELGTFRGPGRRDDPCPYATLLMLRLFAAVPDGENHPQAGSGVETILDLWEHSRDKHPYIFYMGDDFRKLKAPSLWYDIVSVTDTLSQFAAARSDGRFQEMVDAIRSKQDAAGMFTPESVYRAYQDWDFGQKRKPSPYLTFLCLRIIKRASEAREDQPTTAT